MFIKITSVNTMPSHKRMQSVSELAVLTHLGSIVALFYAVFHCLPGSKSHAHQQAKTIKMPTSYSIYCKYSLTN